MKYILANLFYYSGLGFIIFKINNFFNDIRVVNYHCTPYQQINNFEKHLNFYSKHFSDVNFSNLRNFFEVRNVQLSNKPGLIISFDDGLRSNYDFALPLLEKHGFTGWFFVPVEFIENSNYDYAISHKINIKQFYKDGRFSINVNELKTISEKHVIGSHTYTHHRMSINDDNSTLNYEIFNSQRDLEILIGKKIQIFCWVGGELNHYTKNAHEIIKSNYEFSFTTNNLMINKKSNPFILNRTNIETDYSLPLVLFQISGLMDLFYFRKRKKIDKRFNK